MTNCSSGMTMTGSRQPDELVGGKTFWPADDEQLCHLVEYSFSDCWQERPQDVSRKVHRLKVLHVALWSAVEFFEGLGIIQEWLSKRIVIASNEQIADVLHIRPPKEGAAKDTGISTIYRTLTVLLLLAKKVDPSMIPNFTYGKMIQLLKNLDRVCLAPSILVAPKDADIICDYFQQEPLFRHKLIRLAMQYLLAKDPLLGPIRRLVKDNWLWSGMQMQLNAHDFYCNDRSAARRLPGVAEDVDSFRWHYERYLEVNCEMAPYGRLLNLPLFQTVDLNRYPHLQFVVLLKAKRERPTSFRSIKKPSSVHYTEEQIMSSLAEVPAKHEQLAEWRKKIF